MKHTLRRAKQRYHEQIDRKKLAKILMTKDRIQLKFDRASGKSAWAHKFGGVWYIVGKQGTMSKTLLPYTPEFHELLELELVRLNRVDGIFDYPAEVTPGKVESVKRVTPTAKMPYFTKLMRGMGLLKTNKEAGNDEYG